MLPTLLVCVMTGSFRYCHDCAWEVRDTDPRVDEPTAAMIEHAVTTEHDVERVTVEWI